MARTVALIFGIVYTLVGILGFIPAIGGSFTQNETVLLGIAPVNLVHNIVHLVIGLLGLSVAGDTDRAIAYCKWVGLLLIALGVLGFFQANGFGIVPLGPQDTWIHLISGAILAIVGFMPSRAAART